jgi:molybdopterin-synthase adenylyltransferase
VRFFIVSVPSIGHARCMAAIAAMLVRKGHAVYWAANATVDYVARTGVELLRVLPENLNHDVIKAPRGSPAEINDWMLHEWFVPLAEAALGPTLEAARRLMPEVIVSDASAFWGPMVADALGLPLVTFPPGLLMGSAERQLFFHEILSPQDPVDWAKPPSARTAPWQVERRLNALRRDCGLPACQNLVHISESLVLSFTTRMFEFAGVGLPEHVAYIGPIFGSADDLDPYADRAAILPRGNDPLVYVTLGNVFADRDDVLDLILGDLADLPIRILVAKTREQGPAARQSDGRIHRLAGPISQASVLKEASLVVCHGGFNTVQESLCHGVPVVALPLAADQLLVAKRLEDLGLGSRVDPSAATLGDVRAAVEKALASTPMHDAARRFRTEAWLLNPVARAVRLLENIGRKDSQPDSAIRAVANLPAKPRFSKRFRLSESEGGTVTLASYVDQYAFSDPASAEAIKWLWTQLRGDTQIQDVLDEWSGEADLMQALVKLWQAGVLEEGSGAERLSEDTRRRFDAQIGLFSQARGPVPAPHPSLNGAEFQERLMRSHVGVMGASVLGSNVVRNLALTGVGRLTLLGSDVVTEDVIARGGWYRRDQIGRPGPAALAEQIRELNEQTIVETDELSGTENGAQMPWLGALHLLIVSHDSFYPDVYARVNMACHDARVQWTSVRRRHWNVEIGPTVIPGVTACFECYEKRRIGAQASDDSASGHPSTVDAGAFHLALGADWVVVEALKLLTGFGEAASVGRVMMFSPLRMTLTQHRVLRLPYCPRCSTLRDEPPRGAWRQVSP